MPFAMYGVMRFILQRGQSIVFGQEYLGFQQSGSNLCGQTHLQTQYLIFLGISFLLKVYYFIPP